MSTTPTQSRNAAAGRPASGATLTLTLEVQPGFVRKIEEIGERIGKPAEEVLLRAVYLYDFATQMAGEEGVLRLALPDAEGPDDEAIVTL